MISVRVRDLARELFSCAGLGGDEPTGPGDLAVALFGPYAVRYVTEQREPYAVTIDPPGITLSLDLPDDEFTMSLARALARWWSTTRTLSLDETELEDLAACVAMPPGAFHESAQRCGGDARELAREFVCPLRNARRHLRALRPPIRSGIVSKLEQTG